MRLRVLAVDDEPENLELLARSLRRTCEVVTAETAEDALDALHEYADIALILTDYRMPGMNGAELLARTRQLRPGARRVLITAFADSDAVIEAVNEGGAEFLIRKPFERKQLLSIVDELLGGVPLEAQGTPGLGTAETETEKLLRSELEDTKRALERSEVEIARLSRELDVLSFQDSLTGLYNHKSFQERLREEIARARRYDKPLSLLYGDIDNFAKLNRELGYLIGDDVLRCIARIVRSGDTTARLRDSDIVSRIGGEEIAVLLPETGKPGAEQTAERIRAAIASSEFPQNCAVTMSLGVASYPEDAIEPEQLVRCAESSMRAAKKAGRNRVFCYRTGTTGALSGDDDLRKTQLVASERDKFATYHSRLREIIGVLERDRTVACLYVDLSALRRVEMEFGVAKHGELFQKAGRLLEQMRGDKLRRDDLLCRSEDGDAYLCFLGPPRSSAPNTTVDLDAIAQRVTLKIEEGLRKEVAELTRESPRVIVGFARVLRNGMLRAERLISRLVTEARQSAELQRERAMLRDKAFLQEVILHEQLQPVYQPIVQLEAGEVFGFEALTRGPRESSLETPVALFSVADEVDLTFELDRACFRGCLRGAVGLEPVHRLFLNLLPLSFYDTEFIEIEVSRMLDSAGLTPANVVFEITEKLAIENFASFREALARYTALGFGVAIDDVGTRHSNLETVMALRPHFIKISDVLTRGISQSTVKREMLRSLQRIGETIDAVIVAEGIETPDDLAVLCDCGIRYGQGFFLARPGPPFPRLRPAVKRAVRALAQSPGEPIPAPPAEFDEDGDFTEEHESSGVHLAVLARVRNSGETGLEELVSGEVAVGSKTDIAIAEPEAGTVAERVPREDTQPHIKLPPEPWTPLDVAELGVEEPAERASLLDSLRRAKTAPPTKPTPAEPDGDPEEPG